MTKNRAGRIKFQMEHIYFRPSISLLLAEGLETTVVGFQDVGQKN